MKKKPDFSPCVGSIVDPQFLSASGRRELLLHLETSSLTKAQKDSLVNHANDTAHMVMEGSLEGAKAQQEQLKAVAASARRLMSSLKALSQPAKESLEANADYLAHQAKKQIRQADQGLLSPVWDLVDELEACAEYAAGNYKIDRTSKPAQLRSREIVSHLAAHVRVITGTLPPKDRAAWFAAFSECLGGHLGLTIGPRIVSAGIKSATR